MKFFRNLGRHLRDGLRNLFRNGWMTTASIIMMTVTLFMLGLFVLIIGNVDQLTKSVEQEIQVRVMIDPLAEVADEQALGEQIAQIDQVTRVVYRSAEEELASYKDVITEDFDVLEGDTNPLNNMYLVNVASTDQIEKVSKEIQEFEHVLSANIGSLNIDGLIRTINILRYIAAFFAAIFIIIAVLLISNTIRLTINARQTEIEIMRLVGAKNSYIRAPFALEGAFIGMIGAFIATLLLYASYQGILGIARELFAFNPEYALAIWPLILWIGLGLLLAGMILGTIGARRSIHKFLKA
ncbi:ABC transporter permease [Facklamia sp. DSM 111018]|uniref:Cell division protein FtsX n=1 Tax=Facklamia lactis TaxID=2749967 RepID=A0ABS0LUM7_9LACT|nr:permease-like cell division protein FtsX [Facklamia lactis]MBG9981448.1 ABC transporter permease [Facklamia lactis]MBG9987076.1 ABC transporter permease [Facklamia lactis]